jgi:nucleotide-binding universal stress UspA family protein
MKAIRNILFPVDFSESCVAMAHTVKRAAAMASAKVTLLHVLEAPSSSFELLVRPLPDVEKNRGEVARARLDAFLEAEFPANKSPRLLVAGDPAAWIEKTAREGEFDLIAMPTHAGMFRRMLIGSTTAKVLNDADCPLLTTRHAESISPREIEHKEWVCAVGLNPDSLRVIRYASQIAESLHANLTLIHVIPTSEPDLPDSLGLEERVRSAKKEAATRRLEEFRLAAGSRAPVRVAVGAIRDALTEIARDLQADLFVIGRSPQPGTLGRMRDLTYAIVRDAPCPVLSV